MPKLAVRLLILSMFTTSLLVGPVVTEVNATTQSGKEISKKKRVVHRNPAPARTRAADPGANPFASKYDDDFDRKNAGGAGGY
jgi:hypothetical protein